MCCLSLLIWASNICEINYNIYNTGSNTHDLNALHLAQLKRSHYAMDNSLLNGIRMKKYTTESRQW